VNFSTFLTPSVHKNLITPLCSSLVQTAIHADVHLSIATDTLKEGTTNNQGQTIRIWCTMLTSLSHLPLTRTLLMKKCRNYLKCSHTNTCIWQQKTGVGVYTISYNILTYIPWIHMYITKTKEGAIHHEYTKYTVLFQCKIL
jgi:hypothetical protein